MSSDGTSRHPVEELAEEFVDRHRRGERPSVADYVARYPDWAEEIRDVFPALLVMEEGRPRQGAASATPPDADSTPVAPERLGDYRIVREVGRGGMGIVYEAVHEALGRRVALKVLSWSALQDPVQAARFRREVQAAARLHHTNIVPVFGVGEAGGVPFYSMQLIEGRGLNQVLDERRRGEQGAMAIAPDYFRWVAGVVLQAAEAMAYAHAQEVVHRDIKPSNLLLDAQGTLWVTDFGLAKRTASPGCQPGEDDLTETGDVVGTLRYLAPERFHQPADARSDQYSLGLTLYELLTLRPAFDADERGPLIRQVMQGDLIPPRRLNPAVPSDLETICLKCLQKEPGQRYPSAALADDLRRFLDDRPILARRIGPLGHAWRWCRRNPALASVSAAALMLLITGLVVVTWLWQRAVAHERLAESHFQSARTAVEECFTTVTEDPVFQQPDMEDARAVLFRTALKYYQDFRERRRHDPTAQADLAAAHARIGFITAQIGSAADAVASHEEACTLYRQLVEAAPGDEVLAREWVRSLLGLGRLYFRTDRFAEAEATCLQAIDLADRRLGEANNPDARQLPADARRLLATVYQRTKRSDLAEARLVEAIGLRTLLAAVHPDRAAYQHSLAGDRLGLANVYYAAGRWAEVERLLGEVIERLTLLVRDHPGTAEYAASLADASSRLGGSRLDRDQLGTAEQPYCQARDLFERLAREHPRVSEYQRRLGMVYSNLGLLYSLQRRGEEAEAAYTRALALRQELVNRHPEESRHLASLARTHGNLALLHSRTDRPREAEPIYLQALAVWERLLAAHPAVTEYTLELAGTCNDLGELALRRGELPVALAHYDRAVRTLEALLKAEPRETFARRYFRQALAGRADVLTWLGRHAEALADWDRVRDYCDSEHHRVIVQMGRATTLADQGEYRAAVAAAEPLTAKRAFPCQVAPVYAVAAAAAARDQTLAAAERARLAEVFARQSLACLVQDMSSAHEATYLHLRLTELKTSRSFAGLRSRPEFTALVAEAEAKLRALDRPPATVK